ncbi:hypothetical protein BZG02_09300 [Labilibaculum filiforme]|uniref:Haem-binding uptake Tiki superfamily ChaN domain-containing protein n=1 Tax=Labilibaculum filiforme TaxID=1940526 RepID=A0A2N3HZW4_9BACT|nr:hypothetical protein [Labilibaculum filiforme]PKQ63557.1 hypothetical protein BZG02_09300 [Labilibaculum filiforme]
MKMKRVLIVFFCCLSLSAYSQNSDPFAAVNDTSYFNGYLKLKTDKSLYLNTSYESIYWQAYGTLYSFLGRYDEAKVGYDNRYDQTTLYKEDLNLDGKQSSQEELNKLYSKFNVCMINEAHHMAQNRAFMYSQLKHLKKAGYKYLAIEALNAGIYMDSTLVDRGYPLVQKTGVYISEPIFGMLIRQALELDFILIPYESYEKERELGEANNIYKLYDPEKGKLVVYAGYGHICEDETSPYMASILKGLLKEDFLTITQTLPKQCKPITDGNDTCKFYLLPRSNECYDYTVIPNLQASATNIPYWYDWMNCTYQKLKSFYKPELTSPSLVQLFRAEECENAVPVYQYLIEKDDEQDITLPFITKGNYRLVIVSEDKIVKKEIFVD